MDPQHLTPYQFLITLLAMGCVLVLFWSIFSVWLNHVDGRYEDTESAKRWALWRKNKDAWGSATYSRPYRRKEEEESTEIGGESTMDKAEKDLFGR